jgi:hypothetical protein
MKHLIALFLVAFTASTFAAEPTKAPDQKPPSAAKERKKVTPDFDKKKKEKAPAKKPAAKPLPKAGERTTKPATEPAK